ncbi:MAG: glycosyltransferase family 39 protein [Anaerolineales bacterium]|nr:MAG: glycosyltransferase family 39 protein [Anaerolineales bacterium]
MTFPLQSDNKSNKKALWFDALLVLVLLAGAYFRLVGINWGEYQYLHPDERFFVWVGTDIQPVGSDPARLGSPPSVDAIPWRAAYPEQYPDCTEWGGYFDASCSPLNPNNRGHGFYVYGTLPLFMARYLVEWIYGHSGFNEMTDIGRVLSVLVDLLVVFLVYLIAARLYDRRVGILASAFSAFAVLQIQLSHYFTVDTFLNFFTYLAIYFAVRVAGVRWPVASADAKPFIQEGDGNINEGIQTPAAALEPENPPAAGDWAPRATRFLRQPGLIFSVAFGFALGCAVASKLNAAPVAIMLPFGFGFAILRADPSEREARIKQAVVYVGIAAAVSILTFRIFQPYAFSGPGFFGLRPNPQWVANIREQRVQAAGDVDFPPAMQWARRPVWFSFHNLVTWGLGLPLGLLAFGGFLWAGWRMLSARDRDRSAWRQHGLLWIWTGAYFLWQSLQFNPTMRYQLPIYPALAVFAGWALVALYDKSLPFRGAHKELVTANTFVSFSVNPVMQSPAMEELATSGLERPARQDTSLRAEGLSKRPPSGGSHWPRRLSLLLAGVILSSTFAWAYAFSRIYANPITRVEASRWIYQNVPGPINIRIDNGAQLHSQPVPFPYGLTIAPDQPFVTSFTPRYAGEITEILFPKIIPVGEVAQPAELSLIIARPGESEPLASASFQYNPPASQVDPVNEYLLALNQPLPIQPSQAYQLVITMLAGSGEVSLLGAAPANETSWDDGLPLRLDGQDGYGGIYQTGLNFEMYWDDNQEKYERMVDILDQADYLFISSSRQWGSLPRIPERYPLVAAYYRSLLGCPSEHQVEQCYNVAQPDMFSGELGFELVKVFQSDPTIGALSINDQPSEEAFTVYDHPKVFIFRKSPEYDPARVRAILGAVDLSQVVHVTPKRAGYQPANLMLPPARWAEQQAGGTWSQLFNTQALYNRYPVLGAALWYVSLALLGLLCYPLVRLALPGLSDRGYPLARTVGLLLLSYLVWIAGSARVPFSRLTILLCLMLLAVFGLLAAMRQKEELRQEWRSRRGYLLTVEGLFLLFFVFDLLIRIGNPDLWHPWKGGEKPMDFAYFNAVLKSTTFPPYDPWYAGGYLNYYYYGFMFVGVLVKFLGILPAVAYNLIIPTLFALIALGAFSLGWNLLAPRLSEIGNTRSPGISPYWSGLAAALGMAVLGNLGSVRMIFQGYQRLVAPGGVIEGAGLLTRWGWTISGALRVLAGEALPYSLGDWYWIPSRAIPAPGDVEPITEFPFFTVIYADLHAHLFALPLALLALAFALSVVLSRGRWSGWLSALGGFVLGGLAIGALRPTNTWDFYPYLALGSVALLYALTSYYRPGPHLVRALRSVSPRTLAWLAGVAAVMALTALAHALFRPYTLWYGLGYGKISLWTGTHTSLAAYFTHWGLFLFLILSWMIWETRDWLASTPLSALRKLRPYRGLIQLAVAVIAMLILILLYLEASIAWLVLPLAAWAGVLLLRPGLSDAKRFVLFLVGTGLVLTLMVEVIVLVGDVGRMNTVFKFYLQVWTLLAVCAAAALGWLLAALPRWYLGWRAAWQIVLVGLVFAASLYPLLGATAKVKDRIAEDAPHTLDGMAFMAYASYTDTWGPMDLSQDYQAIRWMQENVSGSPVIVEANLRELYRWGSRFSIYTGLPGVVGWEWHQQQQRALLPGGWVSDRIAEIDQFYTTTDPQEAIRFLRKYDVRYIVLGQQERGHYPGPGLAKFPALEGSLWQAVYQDRDTIIYRVVVNP